MTSVPAAASRVRVLVVSLVALVVGGLLALGMSAPAFATTTMVFTVKLTSKTGVALPNYHIYPVQLDDHGAALPVTSTVNPAAPLSGHPGTYTMSLNVDDPYTLILVPSGSSANSGTMQYLGGSPTVGNATAFTPSATNVFLAASIATGSTIVGTVTGPTGVAAAGAEVDEYEYDGTHWYSNNYTIANSHGQYSFTNVDPGSYKFEFVASRLKYPAIYSGGATTLAAAHATFVPVGATATVNQKFAVGTGSIYGTAIDNFDGDDFYRDHVIAAALPVATEHTSGLTKVADTIDTDRAVYGAPANSHGQWVVSGLPAGDYVIQFQPYYSGETANYLNIVDNDSATLGNATVFSVTAGHKTNAGTSTGHVSYNCGYYGEDCGGDLQVKVFNSGLTAVSGAIVHLTPDANPFSFVSGVSDASGSVALKFSDGSTVDDARNSMLPGWYQLTVVDPTGAHEPIKQEQFVDFGVTSSPVHMSNTVTAPALTDPSIAEADTAIGTNYVVAGGVASRGDATVSYQWLRNGRPIYGAMDSGYTAVGGDLNTQLSVAVTASSFGFIPITKYAVVGGDTPTPETSGDAPQNSDAPSLSPTSGTYLGTTIQAHVGDWTLDGSPATGLSYTYLWSNGATTSSIVVQKADLGSDLSVQVTAHKAGYTDSDAAQSGTVSVSTHPTLAVTKSPVITAKVSQGVTTYSVSNGSWNASGANFTYVWSVGGVTKSTSASVTSTAAGPLPATDPLTVVVTAHKDGYDNHDSAPLLVAVKGKASFTSDTAPAATDLTTGTPVSGSDVVTFGDHLSVTHGDWLSPTVTGPSTSPDSYHYQWYRNGLAISGATAATYTVVAADVATSVVHPEGAQLSVVETPVSTRYASTSTSSLLVGIGTAHPFSTAPLVALHGAPADNQTITSTLVGSWGTTGVTVSYQWYGCSTAAPCADSTDATTFTPIPGGTKTSLVLHSTAYTSVALAIVGKKSGYAATTVYSGVVNVNPATSIQSSGETTISGLVGGQAGVWQKLTAVAPKWSQTGVTLSYQWQTQSCFPTGCVEGDWVDVPAPLGTASTFTPTDAMITPITSVRVAVTAHKLGSTDSAPVYSEIYEVRPTLAKVITKPTITSSTAAFTLKPGTLSVAAQAAGTTTPTVTWLVNNAPYAGTPLANPLVFPRGIATGTNSTDAILATVDFAPLGYQETVVYVLAQKGLANPVGGEAIVGTRYGQKLTLVQSNDSGVQPWDKSLNQTYQWYSNGVAIKGATADTFTPSSAYIGKHIQAKVSGSAAYYAAVPITTSSSFTLLGGAFATPAAPTIAPLGSIVPGTLLTVTPDSQANYGTTGITFKYQWQRRATSGSAWANISGAVKSTYTPVATDVTQQLQVIVTATKSGYASLAATSAVQDVLYSPTLATFIPPALTATGGTAKVGVALTVTPGVWNTPGLTYTYIWYRGATAIPGVTGTIWTATPDSYGDAITVAVTAHRAGYLPVTVDSTTVAIGLGSAPALQVAPKITVSGGVYTILNGTWSIDGLSVTYDWTFSNEGGTGAGDGSGTGQGTQTYTPASGDHGTLSVVVTATRTGYPPGSVPVTGPTLP